MGNTIIGIDPNIGNAASYQLLREGFAMTGNEEESTEAAFDLQETTELLNTAYEAVAGSSTILDMLYVRLQEAYEAESTEMAGIVFVVRRSLDESVRMIGDAEEALSSLKELPKKPTREVEGR